MVNVFIFYGAWILFNLIVSQVGRLVPSALVTTFSYVFILVMLFGMSCLSRHYQLRIEPSLLKRLTLRLCLLGGCIFIFVGGYTAATFFGVRSNFAIAIHTANLIFFACLAGHWLTAPLKRPAELLPLCLVMSLVDIYSVFQGPTRELTTTLASHYSSGQAGPPPFVDFILVKLPQPGLPSLVPVFGVVDWIMIVMLSGAAAKLNLNDNLLNWLRTGYFPAAGLGLILTIFTARALGAYLPALPMIAMCFLAVIIYRSPDVLKLSRRELPAMVFCAVFACGVFAVFFL